MVGNLLSSDGFRRKADAHVLVIYIKPEETLEVCQAATLHQNTMFAVNCLLGGA